MLLRKRTWRSGEREVDEVDDSDGWCRRVARAAPPPPPQLLLRCRRSAEAARRSAEERMPVADAAAAASAAGGGRASRAGGGRGRMRSLRMEAVVALSLPRRNGFATSACRLTLSFLSSKNAPLSPHSECRSTQPPSWPSRRPSPECLPTSRSGAAWPGSGQVRDRVRLFSLSRAFDSIMASIWRDDEEKRSS